MAKWDGSRWACAEGAIGPEGRAHRGCKVKKVNEDIKELQGLQAHKVLALEHITIKQPTGVIRPVHLFILRWSADRLHYQLQQT